MNIDDYVRNELLRGAQILPETATIWADHLQVTESEIQDAITRQQNDVRIYAAGMVFCSVCAPAFLTADEVVAWVKRNMPAGTQNNWRLHPNPFADGSPNPSPCNQVGGENRKHYLLSC